MTHTGANLVLIVEDDRDTQEALVDLFAQFGYQVEVAGNGQEALDHLRAASASLPCVIILDVMMPVMDGWKFRAEQRKDPTLASIPVIFVTADPRAQKLIAAAGDATFVPKPVQVPDLLRAVRAVC